MLRFLIVIAFTYSAIVIFTWGFDAWAQPVGTQTDADIADKAARSPKGKLVRIIGTKYDRQALPSVGLLGSVVEVTKPDFTKHSLCHVLLKGLSILDDESGYHVPYIPELFGAFGKSPASWPVKLARSCRADGCYWIVLLRAEDCLIAADGDGYQASTMKEMLTLHTGDLAERGRFLWTVGNCTDPETLKNYECPVPISDPKAILGRDVRIPSGWAGRHLDLDFRANKNDKVLPRSQ